MNEEYIDNVKHLIEQKDADKVKELLVDLHPADIAELCDDLNPEEARFIYRSLLLISPFNTCHNFFHFPSIAII